MRKIRISWIIHGFALLHVAATILCTLAGIGDSLVLTLLTMALVVIISLRRNLTVEITATAVVLVNIIGFILGRAVYNIFAFGHPMLQHALSTFCVTEFLGWVLDLFARRFHPRGAAAYEMRQSWRKNLGWMIFAVLTVFAIRVYVDYIFNGSLFEGYDSISLTLNFLDNSLSVVLMIAASAYYIHIGKRIYINTPGVVFFTLVFILLVSTLGTLIVTFGIPFEFNHFSMEAFLRNSIIGLLAEMTIFSVVYMVAFAVRMQREASSQRELRHHAEFRYMTLKNQVNPHFLFNSLNVLDSIVQDSSREEASGYIHKLAGIYRYMLQHESHDLVRLREELDFARMYIDLIKIRYPEGLETSVRVAPEDLEGKIVPCTLELLLENAIKHNAVSPSAPLEISLSSDGRNVTVRNILRPKVSKPASTGLGLQWIRNQYRDLAGAEIIVNKSPDSFEVTLPLLED